MGWRPKTIIVVKDGEPRVGSLLFGTGIIHIQNEVYEMVPETPEQKYSGYWKQYQLYNSIVLGFVREHLTSPFFIIKYR